MKDGWFLRHGETSPRAPIVHPRHLRWISITPTFLCVREEAAICQSPFSIWPQLLLPLFRTCLPDASLRREVCSCCQRQQSRSICVNNNERSDDCLYLLVQQCRQDEMSRGNLGWQHYQYRLCQQEKNNNFLQMYFMGQALHRLITVWGFFFTMVKQF